MPIFFLPIRQMKLVVPFVSVQWPNFQEEVEAAKQRICTFFMKWWEIIQKSTFLVKTILSIIRILYLNVNCQMLFKHVRIAQTHT